MSKIRILIAEDSLTVRKHLAQIVTDDPDFDLIGEAEDGKQAIELCRQHRPDVITMDMMMPVMTGLAATEYIMAHHPTPILVVSSSINRGDLFRMYDALAAGAVDVLEKPTGLDPDDVWERRFLDTVKLVSRIRVITHLRGRMGAHRGALPMPVPAHPAPVPTAVGSYDLVAIGASTGGPGAIVDIMRGLPASFRLPILLVLHINAPFGTAFADWLDAQTPRRVMIPKDGDPVASAVGRIVMAPSDRHLIVRDRRMYLTEDPERHFCRPSVDVLFDSIAHSYGATAVGCLLTGMGRDGAAGLLQIRKAGGATIAQDKATSIVYGMPREAMLLGAAAHILPLEEISGTLVSLETSGLRRRP